MREVLKIATGKEPNVCFTPHVTGIQAGIYSTIHLSLNKKTDIAELRQIYDQCYKDCPFIRRFDQLPKLKDTVGSNYCDIGLAVDETKENVIIVSSIDNLIKGAAGQAVQNMNIMFGLDETLGLL
jgi:N-acetyl-gamma-glutamyl-phosphate reductase